MPNAETAHGSQHPDLWGTPSPEVHSDVGHHLLTSVELSLSLASGKGPRFVELHWSVCCLESEQGKPNM
eukprot:3344772-Amphidinium_carterae.2